MNTPTPAPDHSHTPNSRAAVLLNGKFPRIVGLMTVVGGFLGVVATAPAQPVTTTPDSRVATLQAEMDEAMQQVRTIVNQPVQALRLGPGMRYSNAPEGWFHEGATKPEFTTVDVRQTQTFPYEKQPYITSPLNPGVVFLGPQLEFNSMTKFFYTNYALPKKRLTEAEMVEINRLYRIIGRCEQELAALRRPALEPEELEDPEGGLVLKPIPKERYLWAGIAIAVVLGIYFMVRKAR
jgi:hypothetical protein